MKLIYYADDDLDDLNIFQEASEGSGYTVVVFFTGQELLDTLLNNPTKPDIIFMDILMPMAQGDEILKKIRAHPEYDRIPVVLVTGTLLETQIARYLHDGADYLMKKMYSLFLFKEKLTEILHKKWDNYKPHPDDFTNL